MAVGVSDVLEAGGGGDDGLSPPHPAAAERQAPFHLTWRIRRADDGALRWVEARGMPWPDGPSAAPRRSLGVLADVTERHEAERRRELLLREMRHRVKNILANV